MRTEDVEARITDRTAAVIVTHLVGPGRRAAADIAREGEQRDVLLLEYVTQRSA
jgi:hypothetical protein